MKTPCLGIDFGTKYLKLSAITDSHTTLPSVWEDKQGKPESLLYLLIDPNEKGKLSKLILTNEYQNSDIATKNTVFGYTMFLDTPYNDPILQKLMSRNTFPFQITKKANGNVQLNQLEPETYILKFLQQVNDISHSRIKTSPTSIVITVPPTYTENQKTKMKSLVNQAFTPRPSIINTYTPQTCALYNYFKSHNISSTYGKFLVINIGATVSSTEIQCSGNSYTFSKMWEIPFFVNDVIDNPLFTYVCKKFKDSTLSYKDKPLPSKILELKQKCYEKKSDLLNGTKTKVTVLSFTPKKDLDIEISFNTFESQINSFIEMLADFFDLNEEYQYKAIITTGYMADKEPFASTIADRYDESPVYYSNVAAGAARLASSPGIIKEIILSSFKPIIFEPTFKNYLSASIGILVRQDDFQPIIHSFGTDLPTSGSYVFKTSRDNQQCVKISIYQGESPKASENNLLESITFNNLPQRPRGQICITVLLSLSEDGYLTIEAYTQDRLFSEKVILPDPVLIEEQVVPSSRRQKNQQKMELFDARSLYLSYLKNLRSLIYQYKSNGIDASKYEALDQEFTNKPFPTTALQFRQRSTELRDKFNAII